MHGEFKPDYDEDTASTSSGSINDTGSYQVLDQEKDVNQPQQGEEEDEEVEEVLTTNIPNTLLTNLLQHNVLKSF